jgi:hypothetical protein
MRCGMTRATLITCLTILSTGCGSRWSEKTSEYGRFRVEMPEPATELAGRIPTPQRELLGEGYGAAAYRRPQFLFGRDGPAPLSAVSCTVGCADVSALDAAERGRLAGEIADLRRREELKKQSDSKVVSQGVINTEGCKGIETEIESRFVHIRERVCVTTSRACLLTVIAPESKVRGAEANRFFESFRSW